MKRFNLYRGGMHEVPDGRWVEYADVVERRFGIAPEAPPTVLVAEVERLRDYIQGRPYETVTAIQSITISAAQKRADAAESEVQELRGEVERTKDNALEMQRFQQKKVETAESDAAQLQAVFDLQKTRMSKAIVLWREATGKRDVLPDLGDLLDWLMSDSARQRERADRLQKAGANLALPYEALLVDHESRRWLAPTLWAAIEEGVVAFRALLSSAPIAGPSAEPRPADD